MKVLIAGMGNVLRRDDGFGVEVARRLRERLAGQEAPLGPGDLRVVEVGIGGIHLVHELMTGYDVLVIVDAVQRDSRPGTLHLLQAEVPDLETWPEREREAFLADTHYTTPAKVLILSKALGILPGQVFILGCQPEAYEEFGLGLSAPVAAAVDQATRQVAQLLAQLAQSVA